MNFTSTPTLYEHYKSCTGVSTDTRQIGEGCLFVALKGDKFDANTFAKEALEKGAKFVVIDNPALVEDERFLLVPDGLIALQQLAAHHRAQLTIPVVGLTGSNGKTTTKELITVVLSKKYRTYATKGNLNNHIGVPLTLLAIDHTYELAVVEMGANHQKEIELLSSICQPTHGLITNIGKAHLEGFGGIEGVKKGKGELYDFLAASGGTVFVNAQNQTLINMAAQRVFAHQINYLADADAPVLVQETPFIRYQVPHLPVVQAHLSGSYNFENIAVALAIGQYFDVPAADANAAIAAYNPTNNRSQMVQKGTNTLLMDAYNANPSSMAAAIENFARLNAPRKMVILGDMFELGDDAPAEHLALGKLVAQGKFDVVILAGKLIKDALPALPTAFYFPDKFSLHNWLVDHPQQHTHVLIKGSRGMSLETVVPYL
ncbi:MAG: UDP-N-acetylmuramoyl-tripeptide--D-alanyl-D-alanine ligase [Runella slithyformis]|nr:MAG: UDP-N-acetylmuramoyl-tripeptide--D-alanyl-D-alanine ligase [Runella slithyformis]TAF24563.1 MAG: UDP-N-acetylmuramoyl-tripeptide--D-alanyl-D-alanine ligase [Runella slithyformis]TAF49469.1 MAG: UDP-N-acetylmuramoyl-tripeptide--D-alanyl-D-alanine ligase [Runella slithyformis]TAF79307.1 MAG: UDP-N-acetylmuramoyl-tripeptide--D-alanyl-D-alanine ligase [Runella slithyformis]